MERSARVKASDGAAAGPHGVDVDDRRAGRDARDDDVGAGRQGAVAERDVGGGAAHVEADRALEAAPRAVSKAPATPAAGPESSVATGSVEARSGEAEPPSDCTIRRERVPRAASPEARRLDIT